MVEIAPMHVCAHVNMCDHGALSTGGMEMAAHAAAGTGSTQRLEGGRGRVCVCCEHMEACLGDTVLSRGTRAPPSRPAQEE